MTRDLNSSLVECPDCGHQVPPNNLEIHQARCGRTRKRCTSTQEEGDTGDGKGVRPAKDESSKQVEKRPSKWPRTKEPQQNTKSQELSVAYPVRIEGWGGSICWKSAPEHGSIHDWLEQVKPSQVSPMSCSWIFVQNAARDYPGSKSESLLDLTAYRPALQEIENIIATKKRVPAAAKKACVAKIMEIAKKQRVTVGKWLLFLKPENADEIWQKVAEATAMGKLGCSSKVAPYQGMMPGETKPILCCVYVDDFSDRADVKRVLRALIDMKIWVSSFKPDVFTDLNIYQNNQWRLDPVLYRVQEALDWNV